jgi:dihydrofolate reductase
VRVRKVVVGAFVSLDGVMQAPGGPEEDPTGGFRFGGWVPPFWDESVGAQMGEFFAEPYDLLLGRRTYDIFAAHWPFVETDPSKSAFDALNAGIAAQFNGLTKYVATHDAASLVWVNSQALGADVPDAVRRLKAGTGPRLLTQGSTELVHQLLAAGLVDELRVHTFPIVLGRGKRLFEEGSAPSTFRLLGSFTSAKGVTVSHYEKSGAIETGSFAMAEPTAAELERRRKLDV